MFILAPAIHYTIYGFHRMIVTILVHLSCFFYNTGAKLRKKVDTKLNYLFVLYKISKKRVAKDESFKKNLYFEGKCISLSPKTNNKLTTYNINYTT